MHNHTLAMLPRGTVCLLLLRCVGGKHRIEVFAKIDNKPKSSQTPLLATRWDPNELRLCWTSADPLSCS